MNDDKYACFAELEKKERIGIDFKISSCYRESKYVVIAPHGGKIEFGTSEICASIAKDILSFYIFEGIKKSNNRDLHITSHNFDEPTAISIVAKSNSVVAVHGRSDDGDPITIWIGGLDCVLINRMLMRLRSDGFVAEHYTKRLAGNSKLNICNKGASKKGLQLEFPRSLRDDLVRDAEKMERLSRAIRSSL